jgi:hypothetical protein
MSRMIIFGLVLANVVISSAFAQNKNNPDASLAPYPTDSVMTFQWDYTCANGSGCSFTCAGGGASHVTKLSVYLGTIPVDSEHKNTTILYDFATRESPRNNGFSVSAGLSTLACQVNGMTLDYAGKPRGSHSTVDTTATVGMMPDKKR